MSNSEETLIQLHNKFQKLQFENKKLRLKAGSIDVLRDQLEAKDDENKQLKEHILELQSKKCNNSGEDHLIEFDVSSSGGSESPCRDSPSAEDDITHNDCTDAGDQEQCKDKLVLLLKKPSDHRVFPDHEALAYIEQKMICIGSEIEVMLEDVGRLQDLLSKRKIEDSSGQAAADLVRLQAKIEKFQRSIRARRSFIDLLSDEKQSVDSKITDAISDKDVFLSQFEEDLNQNRELLNKIKLELDMDDEREELGVVSDSSVSLVSSTQEPEATEEAYVMVPKGRKESAELLQDQTFEVKDASPMHSMEGTATPSITAGYVLVQKLQEQVNTISKEKEELLNVNHQWDVQYRLVEREKNQQIEALRLELIRARKELDSVSMKEDAKRREYDRMWAEIRDQLEQEKQANQLNIQEKESLEARMKQLEIGFQQIQAQYEAEKLRNEQLEGNISQLRQMANQWTPLPSLNLENENIYNNVYQRRSPVLAPTTVPSAPTLPISRPPVAGSSTPLPPPVEVPARGTAQGKETLAQGVTVEEIEMLKQQISVYAEDFRTERADRERIQAEKEAMKEEMNELKERFTALQQQVTMYEEDFKREHMEKTRLLRQLQNMQGSPTLPPEYHTPERVTAEQIRAEERRLLQMKENFYSGGYSRYNPVYSRGGAQYPEYPETRQYYAARGPRENVEQRVRIPKRDDIFHGADVVPDSEFDVKDMAA